MRGRDESRIKYLYECPACGDVYEKDDPGFYYCDWINCEHDEPLSLLGIKEIGEVHKDESDV